MKQSGKLYPYKGKQLSMNQLAELSICEKTTLRKLIDKFDWPVEKALAYIPRQKKNMPVCPVCGSEQSTPAGSCYICQVCGTSSGGCE